MRPIVSRKHNGIEDTEKIEDENRKEENVELGSASIRYSYIVRLLFMMMVGRGLNENEKEDEDERTAKRKKASSA